MDGSPLRGRGGEHAFCLTVCDIFVNQKGLSLISGLLWKGRGELEESANQTARSSCSVSPSADKTQPGVFMNEKTVPVGLVGFGTVGAGVARILLEQGDAIAQRLGVRLQLACVVDRDLTTTRPVDLPAGLLTDDISRLLDDDSIEIAIELVGGTTAARELQIQMLRAGKHVVTANKALLAEHGLELYRVAHESDRCIAFEASCAGGIPIVSAIRTGLSANNIQSIYGIVNGTCNYILSNMSHEGIAFAEALQQAQDKGYAEADPTLDINGGDSAHKMAILGSIAFGYELSLADVFSVGIDGLARDDIQYGAEMGYVLKLLAIGEKDDAGRVSLRVHPSFIDRDNALAQVDGSFNAVSVFGDAVGQVMFYGRGAGMMPTASAVVADLVDVALGNAGRLFRQMRLQPRAEIVDRIIAVEELVSRFYLRVMVQDIPGVVATLGRVLGDHQISISGVLQHEGAGPDKSVPLVVITHETQERDMTDALASLAELDVVSGAPVCIRIVDIPEDRES
jgi:homoserine dehydrogenase